MAQPTDVDSDGYVELWPLLIEHAVDALLGSYTTSFPNGPLTWEYLTRATPFYIPASTAVMPGRTNAQTAREYFDQFIDATLQPAKDSGASVVLESRKNTTSGLIKSNHAFLVLNFDKAAGTITLFNPWGRDANFNPVITIDLTVLDDFGGCVVYPDIP